MKKVRKTIVMTATTAVTTLLTTSRAAGETEHSTRALGLDRLADAIDYPVVVLEPPERAPSLGEVVDEVRDRVDELVSPGRRAAG